MSDNMEINIDQVTSAVDALKEFAEKQKDDLLEENKKIFLQLGFKKTPKLRSNFIKIHLPHTLHTQTTDVCLFVKDLDKDKRDYSPTVNHFTDILHEHKVSSVAEVIPLKGLKTEYQPFEAKRNLSDLYQVFLADDRIVRLLPSLLGKHFYGRKRYPVPLNLEAKDLKSEIKKALSVTQCVVGGHGNTCSVTVGHTGQETKSAIDNVLTAVKRLTESVPGGWENIKSLHLKLVNSPALPIHLDLGSPNDVSVTQHKRKASLDAPEDVTTVEHGKVRVTSRGHVQVINDQTKDYYGKRGQLRKGAKKILARQRRERLQERRKTGKKKAKREIKDDGKNGEENVKTGNRKQVKINSEEGTENIDLKTRTKKARKDTGEDERSENDAFKIRVKNNRRDLGDQSNDGGYQTGVQEKERVKDSGNKKAETKKKSNEKKENRGKKPHSDGLGVVMKKDLTRGEKGSRKDNVVKEAGINTENTEHEKRKRKASEETNGEQATEGVSGQSSKDRVKPVKRKSTVKSVERPVKKSRKLGAGKPAKKKLKK